MVEYPDYRVNAGPLECRNLTWFQLWALSHRIDPDQRDYIWEKFKAADKDSDVPENMRFFRWWLQSIEDRRVDNQQQQLANLIICEIDGEFETAIDRINAALIAEHVRMISTLDCDDRLAPSRKVTRRIDEILIDNKLKARAARRILAFIEDLTA